MQDGDELNSSADRAPVFDNSLWRALATRIRSEVKHLMTFHRQGQQPNVFIFSSPRSGTTWLTELIATQGRFKIVNEPFNLRKEVIRDTLGLRNWEDLFQAENRGRIRGYVQLFIDGRDSDFRFKREAPFSSFWHPVTDRIIFKILFAGEDCIRWFQSEFHGHIVLLLRHPIPVALSRTELPRLKSYLVAPFSEHFSESQLAYADEVIRGGDRLQIAVLDWCLKNSVPLREAHPSWIVLTYEQMVVQPQVVINYLADRMQLNGRQRMLERVHTASRSTGKSKAESKEVLEDDMEIRTRRRWLVERWKERVAREEVEQVAVTLSIFGINCYEAQSTMPTSHYLI